MHSCAAPLHMILPKQYMLMRGLPLHAQLRALAYVHFCNNWFHYTMLAWLPTYFSETLDLNLSQAAQARGLATFFIFL